MKNFLLKIFGWIPVPTFVLSLLPKEYKKKLCAGFLSALESQDLESTVLPLILDKIERTYDPEGGKKFKTAREEVDEVMEEYSALRPYRVYFMRVCERKRREYGLPV